MKQAIEESFILDVLLDYTTYKTYFGLIKATEDEEMLRKQVYERIRQEQNIVTPAGVKE